MAGEYAGRPVVFLEYYAGASEGNRESRFQAAWGPQGYSVPMAIVASGFRFSQGPADYYNVFKGMIETDLARPPQVEIEAWWRKTDPMTLRIYATVHNTSSVVLDDAVNAAGIWGLAWEHKAPLGITGMYTRAARRTPITVATAPGASVSVTVDLTINLLVDWNNLQAAAAAEIRPAGTSGAYDMLQAVRPRPAAFSASPAAVQLTLPQGPGLVEVSFAGPHVLSWTATPSDPWITVTPSQGAIGTGVQVAVNRALLTPGAQSGSVVFASTSPDGMSFETVVPVSATYDPNWTRPRNVPRRHLQRATPSETPP